MILQDKTVEDVENTFDYLMGVCGLASQGDKEEFDEGAFDYARMVLKAAERPMQKLGKYEAALHVLNTAEQLSLSEQFEEADQLLLAFARELRETSGTNAKLRKLYTKPTAH